MHRTIEKYRGIIKQTKTMKHNLIRSIYFFKILFISCDQSIPKGKDFKIERDTEIILL